MKLSQLIPRYNEKEYLTCKIILYYNVILRDMSNRVGSIDKDIIAELKGEQDHKHHFNYARCAESYGHEGGRALRKIFRYRNLLEFPKLIFVRTTRLEYEIKKINRMYGPGIFEDSKYENVKKLIDIFGYPKRDLVSIVKEPGLVMH